MIPRYVSFLLCLSAAASGADLFRDDFSRFPPGRLSGPIGELNGAIQEYHYLPHRGVPLGPWANPICYLDAWLVGDEEGKPYLEQQLSPDAHQFAYPIFLTGDQRVERLHRRGQGEAAVFRRHGRHRLPLPHQPPLLSVLAHRRQARRASRCTCRSKRRCACATGGSWAAPPSPTTRRATTSSAVENRRPVHPRLHRRQAGDRSDRFGDPQRQGRRDRRRSGALCRIFSVTTSDSVKAAISERIAGREAELNKLRAENPRPKLWKKFDTPKFGAGRNVRFGDLDGDGVPDMLIAQNIPRVRADAFDAISCLTAVTLDGKVLWQIGPSRSAQRPAHQRHSVPDSRHRRRRQERSGAGARFQAADPGRHDRQGEEVGVDAQGAGRRQGAALRAGQRRFHRLRQSLRQQGPPRDPGQGPLHASSGSSTTIWSCSGRARSRPATILTRSTVNGNGHDAVAIGYSLWDHDGKAAVEPRQGDQGSCRRRDGGQSQRRSRRPSRACTRAPATKASSCSTCAATS